MELKEISEFIKSNNNFSSLTIKDDEFFFEMKREVAAATATVAVAPVAAAPIAAAEAPQEDASLKTVVSPFIGSFHELPEGKKVSEGDSVKKGQVICTIEAMKLFNEITMPEDGIIASVEVSEGDILECEQVIMKYRSAK